MLATDKHSNLLQKGFISFGCGQKVWPEDFFPENLRKRQSMKPVEMLKPARTEKNCKKWKFHSTFILTDTEKYTFVPKYPTLSYTKE